MKPATLRHKIETAYNNLRSYRDCTHITFQWLAHSGEMVEGSLEYELLFQRPNLFKLVLQESKGGPARSEAMHLISDGKGIVDYRPERSEYAELNAPEDTREFLEALAGLLPKHGGRHWLGLLFLLMRDDIFNDIMSALLPPTVHVERKGVELIEGRRVERIVSIEQYEGGDYECTFWFGLEDGQLWRFRWMDLLDVEGTNRQIAASYCEDHREIQVDTKIDPKCFVFHPSSGVRRVEYLPPPLVSPLHGKPAPEFHLPVHGGGTLRLSDLKEQVIVVVCWSLGCPACLPALDFAQKIHKEFAGDKLCVLGVTNDEPGNIRRILDEKGIEFSTLLDRRYEFGEAYGVRSIPRFFVINRGVVQSEFFGIPNIEYIRGELKKAVSGL